MPRPIRFLLILILFASSNAAVAQGSIAGTVRDAVSGEPIIGANVVVQGTTIGSATDLEGNFLIPRIVAGTYSLQVSFVTYKTQLITGVVVEDARRITLDIMLAEDVAQLQEVVVASTRQVDTDFSLLSSIRESKVVVSGISAEQISRSLDRDAAQVIRRVPGVTLSQGQFVQIRGLAERYNVVRLHNVYAPSVETDVRSFSFATLPSSQLDRMLVYKSPAADLPGDFAGGIVNVHTKSIPEENGLTIDYSFQLRRATTFNNFYHQERDPFHFTGFNTGYYDLPYGFPADLRKINGDGLVSAGRSMKNLWTEQKSMAIPDQRLTLTYNKKFRAGHVDIGNITALTYSNTYTLFDVTRSDFNSYNQSSQSSSPIYLVNDKQYNQAIRAGLLFNWAFRFSPEHVIEFKNMYNQSSFDQYVDRSGANFESGVLLDNGAFDKVYRGIYSGQLLGTHKLNQEQTTIEWVSGFNDSYRDQPDYKRYRSDIDALNNTSTLFVPVGAVSPDFLGRFFSNMNERAVSGGLSVKQRFEYKRNPVLSPELKVGGFFEKKDREFKARNIGFIRASSSNFDNALLSGTIGELFEMKNINNSTGIRIDEQSNPNDNYSANNLLVAYYGMVTVPVSRKFSVDAGVRVEENTQEMHSALFTGEAIDVKYPVTSVLPSATITYNITENMMIRGAYGKTVNRPEFRELAPFGFYDFNFNFTNKGNPYLQVAEIQNFDLRWELYPTKAETVSLGLFYKDFTNPIETVFNPGSGSLGAKSFTYQNAQSANNYGVEVELRKSLTGMSGSRFLNDMSVLFNMSLIHSQIDLGQSISAGQSNERPLQGQAPYVINAGLFYDEPESGWQVNLLYNVVGKNIIFVGFEDYPDLYLMPRNVVDLTFSKRVGERWQLKGGVADILNQEILILQDGNQDDKFDRRSDQVIQKFKPGQLFSLGFSVRI